VEEHDGGKHALLDDTVDKIIVMVEAGDELSVQYDKVGFYQLEDLTLACLLVSLQRQMVVYGSRGLRTDNT
jgi:hypothetical protein